MLPIISLLGAATVLTGVGLIHWLMKENEEAKVSFLFSCALSVLAIAWILLEKLP